VNQLNYDSINTEKNINSGLALILIFLIAGHFLDDQVRFFYSIIPITLIIMTFPNTLKPFSFLWYRFSFILGAVVSKIMLSLIFYCFLTPLSLVINLFRGDPLKLKQFKKDTESLFINKNKKYKKSDIIHPF
tara:strand:+ start:231 stop:626 length:396 start_codon:yes stop_codon:yes gene_type:complete